MERFTLKTYSPFLCRVAKQRYTDARYRMKSRKTVSRGVMNCEGDKAWRASDSSVNRDGWIRYHALENACTCVSDTRRHINGQGKLR